MALHFHKKAVSASSATLATLLKKYESYGEKIEYPEDDEERHDKCSSNMVLLVSCLSQIKTGIDSLQSKIDKMELQYANAKSKTEQKELLQEIEDFEKESKYSETLREAEGFQYVVEANIADTKIKLRKVQLKLKLPVQSDISEENTSTSGESSRTINPAREIEEIPEESRRNRSAKPPIIKLPKFYGNQEEFPEYWALYESLIHNCNELTAIEKIVLLKESLKGPAETVIRGIKPIPSNYEWMIETLRKRFSNQPTNRSKIVQKLFDLPHAGKKADSCQRCYDSITTLVHQMVSAGYDIRRTCDPMWTETIIKKFPYEIVKDVLVKNQEVDSVTIQELLDILEKEISAKAYVELRLGFERSGFQGNLRQEGTTRSSEHCVFCNRSNHISVACRTVPDQSGRKEILKQKRLCWKCFAQDHSSNLCRRPNCSHCGRTHHSSLCTAAAVPTSIPVDANQPRPSRWNRNEANQRHISNRPIPGPQGRQHVTTSSSNRPAHSQFNTGQRFSSGTERPVNHNQLVENEHTTISSFPIQEQLILMTAEGNIFNHNSQQYERVLFFFDTGAQKTVIEENLATKFGLPRITTETCVMSGIGGHTEKFESHSVRMNITTVFGAELEMIVQTKPIITGGFPAVKLSKEDQEFLQMKELCIANSKVRGERLIPHILVGIDRYYDLVVANTTALRTPSGLHVAKTVFGPTIYGRGMIDSSQNNLSITHNYTSIEQPTEVAMLERMFELEGLGISTNELQKDDPVQKYFEQYKKSISFENGYVTAPFPLKDNIVDLEDNYSVSIKRLSALQRQLSDNKEQCSWYSKILTDYENGGIIERVHSPEACAVGTYYMPHSGVWRPHKKVPLRIVFDASSKRRGQLSLNDAIYKGESFVNKIQDILVASRTSNIIMLCDIEAAFTQIRLPQENKDLCRFLWLKNYNLPPTKNNVIEYRFTRLAFGITAAPSILNMCIAAYLSTVNTDLAREIAENIYVDNILLQTDTSEEALQKYRDSKALFAKIGMNLREYVSNSDLVNRQIPEQDRVPTGPMKYLGMEYDTVTDRFTVKTHFPLKTELKKRDVVSQLNSIYDPLGIAGPLLIELKSMMRDILHAYSDWNDRLTPDVCHKWNKKCSEVNNALITVSRSLLGPVSYSQIATRLWVFADASKAAIAACAYIQAQESNEVSQLVTGKTRLAPQKNVQTIPRLELLGILIAMRLATTTTAAVNTVVKEVHVVTDSEVALCWIKSTRKLPVFVSNQCVRIQNLKSELEKQDVSVHFHHVPTAYNPADAGTRGLTKEQMLDHDWVHGPRWLCKWPNIAFLRPIEIVQAQEPASDDAEHSTSLLTVKSTPPVLETVFDLSRLSRLSTALRAIACVGKFLHRIISKVNEKRGFPIQLNHVSKFSLEFEINAVDIKAAETILYADTHRNIDLDELSKKFRNMHIVRDKDGVIRHISRLQHAAIPLDAKSPIFLPNRGELTRLVITDIHYRNFHCGKDQTLSLARQRFWIPRASGSFKYYLKNCAVCKRWQGLPFGSPNMPPLPSDRVVITKPFSNVGCDFIGPLNSKTGENMYICLYTCLVTRAVHLEAVENMTAGAFLNSFIRFVSRRGVPLLIRSDCGANFRLGSKIIEELSKPDESTAGSVMSYSADNGIKWVFNPPASPWMGGVWERLVGSVKRCMRKSVGRKKLTFTELSTVIAAIEAVINTRPLTKLSSTDLSEIPLRPVDFIQRHVKFSLQDAAELGASDDPSYEPNFVQTRKQAIEAITTSEKIASKFWEKWSTEYLTTLRESQKLHLKQSRHVARTAPETGEIVLIEQDLLPRGCWSYGKIVEVISSNDGLIRTAKVLTPSGITLLRPINKLYPLEIRLTPEENSEESIIHTPPLAEQISTRPVLPRSSKTRAYDIIKDFENSLKDTHISGMSVDERSNKDSRNQKLLERCPQRTEITKVSRGSMQNILLVALIVVGFVAPATAKYPKCDRGTVEITEINGTYELCFNEECREFIGNETMRTYELLPSSSSHNETRVTVRYGAGDNPTEFTTICLNPDVCTVSSSILSISLLGNPHCWPVGAAITAAIILYLATIMMFISLFLLITIIRIASKSPARTVQNTCTITGQQVNVQLHSLRPTPLSGGMLITLCVIILIGNNTVTACQHGFTRHATNIVCSQDGNCSYEFSRELLFNRIQTEHCVEIRHRNKTVGLLKMKIAPTSLVCSKVSKFFTKSTEIRVFSRVRCPQAGSCFDNVCDKIRPNETIPELSRGSKYPGYSGCQYTCGGLSCGCFLPAPSCTFYRVAHVPISDAIYEVVECSEWIPSIHVEVESTLYQETQKEDVLLQPYVTYRFHNFNITATSVQKPSLAILHNRFALSPNESLILPNRFAVPVECTTQNETLENFRNCINKVVCDCNTGWTKHHCHCPSNSLRAVANDNMNHLPLVMPHLEIHTRNGGIVALTEDVEIIITVQSQLLVNSAELVYDEKCDITLSNLSGCYNCLHGATVETVCKSVDFTKITILCDHNVFSVECGPTSPKTNVHLRFDSAVIRQKCYTVCGNEKWTLPLNGTLFYHRMKHNSVFKFNEDKYKGTSLLNFVSEIHIPDLNPLLKVVYQHWKAFMAAGIAAVAAAGLTYLFGPLILITIIKLLVSAIAYSVTTVGKVIGFVIRCIRQSL